MHIHMHHIQFMLHKQYLTDLADKDGVETEIFRQIRNAESEI